MTIQELKDKIIYAIENISELSILTPGPGVTIKICGSYRKDSLDWFALQYSIDSEYSLSFESHLFLHFFEVDEEGNRAQISYELAGNNVSEEAESAAKIILRKTKDWEDCAIYWIGD